MKMKGMSIAIETIIFIILAVIVLTVLLFFFTSQAGPAQDRFALENTRNQYCGIYIENDRECRGDGVNPSTRVNAADINKLVEACKKLSVADCGGADKLDCIKNCCLACINVESVVSAP